jgi:hypothetical protein
MYFMLYIVFAHNNNNNKLQIKCVYHVVCTESITNEKTYHLVNACWH